MASEADAKMAKLVEALKCMAVIGRFSRLLTTLAIR